MTGQAGHWLGAFLVGVIPDLRLVAAAILVASAAAMRIVRAYRSRANRRSVVRLPKGGPR